MFIAAGKEVVGGEMLLTCSVGGSSSNVAFVDPAIVAAPFDTLKKFKTSK